jgi:GTP cyclohydrolase IA
MPDGDAISRLVQQLLKELGEDPHREGLDRTPDRVAAAMRYLTSGYQKNAQEILNDALFVEEYDEMVIVKDIDVTSLCEHHLLPFIGKAHLAYIPNQRGQLTGLSKLARLVDGLAKRPQVQERLTSQVADALMSRLAPLGALVVIEAEHLCMSMRGVRKPGAVTVTSAVRGVFRDSMPTRMEAMNLIGVSRRGE